MTPAHLSSLSLLLSPLHPASTLASLLLHPHTSPPAHVHPSLVYRWMRGDRPIPPWVEGEVVRLLEERRDAIEKALQEVHRYIGTQVTR